ncbi:MAG: exodeoxyribonuclease V subunit alpha [Desulfatibacillaceae bacterium]|nr:exodeoxyribonuclease V subunit alpha [Desulfatibacillaceae bacterium]
MNSLKLQSIDKHFAAFCQRLNKAANPALFDAAVLVSAAARAGHTCINLSQVFEGGLDAPGENTGGKAVATKIKTFENFVKEVKKSQVVASPGNNAPLILDNDNRLYLHRFFADEQDIASAIGQRCQGFDDKIDLALLKKGLNLFFDKDAADQKLAAATAVLRRFCAISGGPGTGKTYTVARILALIKDQTPTARIALCAPTGKAAARLGQSVDDALANLHKPLEGPAPGQASTVHRLLGSNFHGEGFAHNSHNLLPVDALVVDEASMVDSSLMASLVRALPKQARLILLGDRNQLSSVAPGSVLGDIAGPLPVDEKSPDFADLLARATGQKVPKAAPGSPPILDCIATLTQNRRFKDDSPLARLATALVNGRADEAIAVLEGSQEKTEVFWNLDSRRLAAKIRKWSLDGYNSYLKSETPQEALVNLNKFRILSALREGPLGSVRINEQFEQSLVAEGLVRYEARPWYRLKPVMVVQNDYQAGLFNGDIGLFAENEVHFPAASNRTAAFKPIMLPCFETAFAMTVHKSQGSEFDCVLLVLPPADSPILSRELLYTAVTRSREQILVCGDPKSIASAAARRTMRFSGLQEALWGKG